MLSLLWVRVLSLVREPWFHKPCCIVREGGREEREEEKAGQTEKQNLEDWLLYKCFAPYEVFEGISK